MILLIDNYDSFTYNLYQFIGIFNSDIKVVRNDKITIEEIEELNPESIVVSPGPKSPKEAGICVDVIKHFTGKKPILGICLGHQCIGEAFGATVSYAKCIMHGKQSEIYHDGTGIFTGLDSPVKVARYHSLAIIQETLPDCLAAWGGADMLRIREAIVVEGRYDKNTLSQMVDTVIVETSGFGIFKDKERLALLRRLAEKRGLIVLTDPDGAGFVIRSHLKGSIPPEQVKHAYVPDVYGKERRKRRGGKEGKLGVEGMRPEVLEAALRRAGATFLDETGEAAPKRQAITKADLMALGLSGGPGAAERRKELLHRLELPERLSPNALLEVLNALFTFGELEDTVRGADAKKFS